MCGIFGAIGQSLDLEKIRVAHQTLKHRGPDAEGFWFDKNNGIALCHHRLSILDLSEAGAQPMTSSSGRYKVVFNGELYNYLELKNEVTESHWRGHSDTEVLLACIEEWGLERTLNRLKGMYAIALWDSHEKALTLVRDRLGEKPLYYGMVQSTFVFASELKPIIQLFKDRLTLDQTALADFFQRSCISGEQSIFKEIRKLPAGHFLIHPAANMNLSSTPRKYWSLKDIPLGEKQISTQEAIPLLEEQLKKSIRQQIIADVPVGAFLSGGIDSSLIVALMQAQSKKKVKTFTIGFHQAQYNEAQHAKAVAHHLGTEHEELYVTEKELLDQVPGLPLVYDEPFADSSQIPTILVSQMARKYVTVALSGDGGDELFCGYNRHVFADRHWGKIKSIPFALRKAMGRSLLQVSPKTWESLFQLLPVKVAQPHEKMAKLQRILNCKNLIDFYYEVSTHGNSRSPLIRHDHRLSRQDWQINSVLEMALADAKWYLCDDVLVKVDRAAMSQSLESRAPFLSQEVVELAFSLPLDLKIRNGQSKWILRQILHQYVPQDLIERPKMGFSVPLAAWLRKDLKDWAWSLLNPSELQKQDLLDPAAIGQRWESHQRGLTNESTELWDVLMFLAWRKYYEV